MRAANDSMNGMPLENPRHRIAVLADQCVQCGLCLPVCPTYALDANETESPRGRIAIAAALARGQVLPSAELRAPLDHCLGCLSCQRVCPAAVKYEELLVETRALLGPAPARPTLLLAAVKRPGMGRWLQRAVDWTAAAHWAGRWLPKAWLIALRLMPGRKQPLFGEGQPHGKSASIPSPQEGKARTVALFPGCAASVQDADAEQAAVTLLTAAGYRVTRLPAFCCGALDLHDGARNDADSAALQVQKAWHEAQADYLVTVTPGCLSTLRRALPDVRVDDVYGLLAERIDELQFRPLPVRVALHVPCTQANVARSDALLMRLLQRVPALDIRRLPATSYCCGAAGSHVLQFPERATQLRDHALSQIDVLDAQWLLSSNIGCRLHLAAGLAERASAMPTLHPLTLLAQQWIPS